MQLQTTMRVFWGRMQGGRMTAKGCEGPFRGEGNVLHLDQGIKVITCTLKINEFYYMYIILQNFNKYEPSRVNFFNRKARSNKVSNMFICLPMLIIIINKN